MDGDTEKRLAEAEEGEGEEERLTEESSLLPPNQTDGGSAESDTGYASMVGDTGGSEVAQTTLTRTRYGIELGCSSTVHYCALFWIRIQLGLGIQIRIQEGLQKRKK